MKFSDEKIEEICKYISFGNNITDACILSDISRETFYKWKKEIPEVEKAIEKAVVKNKHRNIALIQKAAEKSWQASAWFLERRYNEEYAKRDKHEHMGEGGGPVTVILNPVDGSDKN